MTTPLRQPGLDAVTNLADALDRAQTALAAAQATNAQLLVQQGADQATIARLQAQIDAARPQPGPGAAVLGASLLSNDIANARRVSAALGVTALRVYDGGKGPAALLTQITPLLAAGYQLAASFHLGGLDAVRAFNNGTAAQGVYDAVSQLLRLPIVLIPEHEPDQKNRVPAPDWIALAKKVRSLRDSLGTDGKAELWLCLTGTTPNRASTWFPGTGVIDGIGFDPYSNSTDVQAVCKPFADAVKKLDSHLRVGIFEYGPFATADTALTKRIVESINPTALAALGVTRFYWYDTTVAAGIEISRTPDLSATFTAIPR